MDSTALVCDECGTLHCVPSAPTTPIGDFASSSGPTAEQEPEPSSTYSSDTFPSQLLHQGPPGIMEDVRTELPLEQPGEIPTVNPMHLMGGQQQQEEDLFVQSLELSGLPDEIHGAKPRSRSRWSKCIVVDYSFPCTISASRIRLDPLEGDRLEYNAKFASKGGWPTWEAAEDLRVYPAVLKKFHYENPQMPGPPDWLVEEEGDSFFYGNSKELPKM